MERFISLLGLALLVGIAWAASDARREVRWRLVGSGLLLQLAIALLVLRFPPGRAALDAARKGVIALLGYTQAGSEFLFGSLAGADGPVGFVFAFQVLPIIIFFSSLMGLLYHLGVMQKLVLVMARFMARAMGVSGSESLSVAANVFIGQTEAPLVVRPYIGRMTQSELMVLMTGGMATIAGSVLAGYVGFGIDPGHLLAASVMSAPAALVTAKLLVPETGRSLTMGEVEIADERSTVNAVDAAATGAADGLRLALNVGAMLLAFLALVALFNGILGGLVGLTGIGWLPTSLQELFGILLWPVAWCMGVPAQDCATFAALVGEKVSINEFVAYAHLGELIAAGELQPRTVVLATYALCGFANFGSIAIQIGGIGALAPERRHDLARLGLRAVLGGALASAMTATIAGILL